MDTSNKTKVKESESQELESSKPTLSQYVTDSVNSLEKGLIEGTKSGAKVAAALKIEHAVTGQHTPSVLNNPAGALVRSAGAVSVGVVDGATTATTEFLDSTSGKYLKGLGASAADQLKELGASAAENAVSLAQTAGPSMLQSKVQTTQILVDAAQPIIDKVMPQKKNPGGNTITESGPSDNFSSIHGDFLNSTEEENQQEFNDFDILLEKQLDFETLEEHGVNIETLPLPHIIAWLPFFRAFYKDITNFFNQFF